MFCKSCGKQIKDGAQFCQHCGQKITVPGASIPAQDTIQPSAVQKIGEAQRSVSHMATEPKKPAGKSGISKGLVVGIAIGIAVIVIGVLAYVFISGHNEDADGTGESMDLGYEETMESSQVSSLAESEPVDSVLVGTPEPQTPASTPEPTPEPQEEPASQYILPTSNTQYLIMEDLKGLTKEECRIARNELYARHGRRFNDAELQGYFDSCDWYEGTIAPSDFNDSVLNEYEIANRDLIVQYEKDMGYR